MAKVKVSQGWLQGEELETVTKESKYFSFKGIPYAEPPIGKLRFKAPRPPLSWDGIKQATEHGPVCPQVDELTKNLIPSNEDCLYLNVYTPKLSLLNLLPVMLFIHGGGFNSGSGNVDNYGPDFLIQHEVVVVTFNYRLEALGFLCLDTKEVPGNAGLKDQVAALKWVNENIAHFGGDPNNVTIFGESAGGASVAFHLSSPMSKGLFKRAISMSGVPTCDWIVSFEPRRRAFQLGKILGFETDDPEKLLEYLQSVPVSELINKQPYVLASEEKSVKPVKQYLYVPVGEKDFGEEHFITGNPADAHKKGNLNAIDVLIGHTNEESAIDILTYESSYARDYKTYPELFVPVDILTKSRPETVLNLADKIQKYYFGSKPINADARREFVTYVNDAVFVYRCNTFIRQLPNDGVMKKYFYKFSSVSSRNIYGNVGKKYGIIGASHLEDLMYLFDAKQYNLTVEKNSKEYQLINNFCTVITNFAKYGTPTPDSSLGLIWPQYGTNHSYVEIEDNLTVKHGSGDAVCEFWDSIYEYAGLDP